MSRVGIVGSTGLVGAHILSNLSSSSTPSITAYTRRPLSIHSPSPNIINITSPIPSAWLSHLSSLPASQSPQTFYSALGTTKEAAGSLAAQRAIDYDLNLSIARAAKSAGVRTFVFISGATSALTRSSPFVQMKLELEAAIKELKFDNTVIVKPGLIVGSRSESRPAEAMLRSLARGLGRISGGWLKDGWAQDADVIARAAVRAGERAELDLAGRKEGEMKVWEVSMKEIMSLGRE